MEPSDRQHRMIEVRHESLEVGPVHRRIQVAADIDAAAARVENLLVGVRAAAVDWTRGGSIEPLPVAEKTYRCALRTPIGAEPPEAGPRIPGASVDVADRCVFIASVPA